MPAFSYDAIDASGAVSSGEIQAASRVEAYRLLRARGLQPSSLRDGGGTSTAAATQTRAKFSGR